MLRVTLRTFETRKLEEKLRFAVYTVDCGLDHFLFYFADATATNSNC
jgi:hypothetical protein